MPVTFGLDTFGDTTIQPDGRAKPHDAVLRDVVAEGELADRVGIDHFSVGEHHRTDFAVSAPEIVLAALAGRTERITLGSAVTVLSSDDPIRVFQRFSTLAAVSNGRAEVTLGRGSFTESFPLFGLDLRDYEVLFEEKLDLFVRLLRDERVTWSGTTRPPLRDQGVYPRLPESGLPAWVGVGGSPQSIVRAVSHDLPVMLAIIGGSPSRFAPFADLYRRAWAQAGKEAKPLGVHSPGFVAETDEKARDLLWPHFRDMMNRIGRERGWSPMSRAQFDQEATSGALPVGSPETVARRVAETVRSLGLDRFDMKYSHGTLPHEAAMEGIRLYGEKVVPMVREMLRD